MDKRFLPSSPPPPSLHFLLGQKFSSVKPNGNASAHRLISCLHELTLQYCFYIIYIYQVILLAIKSSFFFRIAVFIPFVIHVFINCLLFLLEVSQKETSSSGKATDKFTSTTVPGSDGDANETGKDNSGREDGVLESVGLKDIY